MTESVAELPRGSRRRAAAVLLWLRMSTATVQTHEWVAEFEAAARRPLRTRLRYAFIHTYKPVLDDAAYRSFDAMADYRAWCETNLPSWLGYGQDV